MYSSACSVWNLTPLGTFEIVGSYTLLLWHAGACNLTIIMVIRLLANRGALSCLYDVMITNTVVSHLLLSLLFLPFFKSLFSLYIYPMPSSLFHSLLPLPQRLQRPHVDLCIVHGDQRSTYFICSGHPFDKNSVL